MSQVTKRALEQSLKNLLLKKPLTKITINDIAEDCGINRMTFYYHFKDIYDLVEWSCLEDARRALEEKKTHDTWQQGLLQIFEAVRQNKPFILNVYRCVDREQVERYLRPLVDHLILGVIDEQSAAMTVRDEDKAFIAQVYGYIFIGIMLDWIRDGMTEEPEKIVDRLPFDEKLYTLRPRDKTLITGALLFMEKSISGGYYRAIKRKTNLTGGQYYVLLCRNV